MKVKVSFDVDHEDPVTLLKQLQHDFSDGQVCMLIEELLDCRMWGSEIEVLEFDPGEHEENDHILEQQELEDHEGLSGFDNPDIERI